jgi:hypothetical protein
MTISKKQMVDAGWQPWFKIVEDEGVEEVFEMKGFRRLRKGERLAIAGAVAVAQVFLEIGLDDEDPLGELPFCLYTHCDCSVCPIEPGGGYACALSKSTNGSFEYMMGLYAGFYKALKL